MQQIFSRMGRGRYHAGTWSGGKSARLPQGESHSKREGKQGNTYFGGKKGDFIYRKRKKKGNIPLQG